MSKYYVDNDVNRRLGRVGLPIGSMVVPGTKSARLDAARLASIYTSGYGNTDLDRVSGHTPGRLNGVGTYGDMSGRLDGVATNGDMSGRLDGVGTYGDMSGRLDGVANYGDMSGKLDGVGKDDSYGYGDELDSKDNIYRFEDSSGQYDVNGHTYEDVNNASGLNSHTGGHDHDEGSYGGLDNFNYEYDNLSGGMRDGYGRSYDNYKDGQAMPIFGSSIANMNTYSDNDLNRKIGRVGLQLGTKPVFRRTTTHIGETGMSRDPKPVSKMEPERSTRHVSGGYIIYVKIGISFVLFCLAVLLIYTFMRK